MNRIFTLLTWVALSQLLLAAPTGMACGCDATTCGTANQSITSQCCCTEPSAFASSGCDSEADHKGTESQEHSTDTCNCQHPAPASPSIPAGTPLVKSETAKDFPAAQILTQQSTFQLTFPTRAPFEKTLTYGPPLITHLLRNICKHQA